MVSSVGQWCESVISSAATHYEYSQTQRTLQSSHLDNQRHFIVKHVLITLFFLQIINGMYMKDMNRHEEHFQIFSLLVEDNYLICPICFTILS